MAWFLRNVRFCCVNVTAYKPVLTAIRIVTATGTGIKTVIVIATKAVNRPPVVRATINNDASGMLSGSDPEHAASYGFRRAAAGWFGGCAGSQYGCNDPYRAQSG